MKLARGQVEQLTNVARGADDGNACRDQFLELADSLGVRPYKARKVQNNGSASELELQVQIRHGLGGQAAFDPNRGDVLVGGRSDAKAQELPR